MSVLDVFQRLRGQFSRKTMEREIAEEVAYHVERETERNLAVGLSPEEARRRALVAFGGQDRFVEAAREEHRSIGLEQLVSDLKVAVRGLRRSPGFAFVAIASLALGIGANVAVFSVVNGVLLRPLPYAEPEDLIRIGVLDNTRQFPSSSSEADVQALMDASVFEEVGAFGPQQGGFALTVGGSAESMRGSWVTAGLLRALGVAPIRGRLFVDADNAPGAERVALLSHGLWVDRYGAADSIVGSTVQLDGRPVTVAGVMPPGFQLPGNRDEHLWLALRLAPEWRAPFWLRVVARPRDGVAAVAIDTELARIRDEVMARYPGSEHGWRYAVEPLHQTIVRDARLTLGVLLGAVALVLVMATANVANLFLARATVRAPELAVRSALGAGRWRLARQLMAESTLLVVLGGVLGLAVAWVCVRLLPSIAPAGLPRQDAIGIDMTVLGFALAATLLVGLGVGAMPALHATRIDLLSRMRERGRGGESAARVRARSALVVLEFALAVMIVVGAGLVVSSLLRLQQVDAGVDDDGVLAIRIAIPGGRYDTEERVATFFDRLVEEVGALPGVQAAGIGMAVPPNRLVMRNPFTPEGKVFGPEERAPVAAELIVDPGYFTTLGIRPVRGRLFDDRDRADAPLVVIIDEGLARQFFPGVDPIGRWLQTGDPDPESPRVTIVGVVPEVRYEGLEAAPQPTLYVPLAQNAWWPSMYLTVRAQGNPVDLVPAIRARVAALDPLIPLEEVRTLDELASESVATPRFRALLLGSFGAIALLLACAGIYGVLAYDVAQRRRETGIRLAIGADTRQVLAGTIGRGMRLAAMGIGLGSLAAIAATRLMTGLLFEIDPLDPATFAGAAATLAVVGLAACALPAWRAARTNPVDAIRAE